MTAQVLDVYPAYEIPASGDDPFTERSLVDGDLWPRIVEGKRRD